MSTDMEKATGLKLYPAYTYVIYKKGDILKDTKIDLVVRYLRL